MESNIRVSIICTTYNHEKYIRKALEGFVMQKTDFAFEALVHDDASTDGTADIIREFEAKYPDIIKPIYQTENLYSQGKPIINAHILPKARGEYLAFCEGDDYWTDPLKLQKQYDFLSNNREYSICMHRAMIHNLNDGTKCKYPDLEEDMDITPEMAILSSGGLCATNSVMLTKEAYTTRPSCFAVPKIGDYQMKVYACIHGKGKYFSEVMSVYNRMTESSWTTNIYNVAEKRRAFLENMINMLENVDQYYNYKYRDAINEKIINLSFGILTIDGNRKEMHQKKYERLYRAYIKAEFKKKIARCLPIISKLKVKSISEKKE